MISTGLLNDFNRIAQWFHQLFTNFQMFWPSTLKLFERELGLKKKSLGRKMPQLEVGWRIDQKRRNTLRMLRNWISWNSLCEGEGFGAITRLFYQDFGNLEKMDGCKFYSKIDDACGQSRNLVLRQNCAKIRINSGLVSVFSGSANFFNKNFISKFMILMSSCLICCLFFQ